MMRDANDFMRSYCQSFAIWFLSLVEMGLPSVPDCVLRDNWAFLFLLP